MKLGIAMRKVGMLGKSLLLPFITAKAWREVRRTAALRDNELCQYCLNQGIVKRYEVVDHFIPIKYDYEKRLDEIISSQVVFDIIQ